MDLNIFISSQTTKASVSFPRRAAPQPHSPTTITKVTTSIPLTPAAIQRERSALNTLLLRSTGAAKINPPPKEPQKWTSAPWDTQAPPSFRFPFPSPSLTGILCLRSMTPSRLIPPQRLLSFPPHPPALFKPSSALMKTGGPSIIYQYLCIFSIVNQVLLGY